ncbi:hypothetical protein FRB94_012190 [Tulasnella sp. JGI-2019a]|nr:hypothetical protein FRB94_012190 [Tulasnella sp. JGI-2019a]
MARPGPSGSKKGAGMHKALCSHCNKLLSVTTVWRHEHDAQLGQTLSVAVPVPPIFPPNQIPSSPVLPDLTSDDHLLSPLHQSDMDAYGLAPSSDIEMSSQSGSEGGGDFAGSSGPPMGGTGDDDNGDFDEGTYGDQEMGEDDMNDGDVGNDVSSGSGNGSNDDDDNDNGDDDDD